MRARTAGRARPVVARGCWSAAVSGASWACEGVAVRVYGWTGSEMRNIGDGGHSAVQTDLRPTPARARSACELVEHVDVCVV